MNVTEKQSISSQDFANKYDLLVAYCLGWPSLTVQYYPNIDPMSVRRLHNVLIGTHTSGSDQEFIEIIGIPDRECDVTLQPHSVTQIAVSTEINRARYSPKDQNLIATRSDAAETFIYDTNRHSNFSGLSVLPDCTLTGHKQGGFGVSWSTEGDLATCGIDGLVLVYDINTQSNQISPTHLLNHHIGPVGDVCFSYFDPNILISVGDDRNLYYNDLRCEKPSLIYNAHRSDIFCIHASPKNGRLCATGSQDGTIHVWDVRKPNFPSVILKGGGEVLQLQWYPHTGSLLAAGGSDNKVRIFDIDEYCTASDDDQPELVFTHDEHIGAINDISWNPLKPMELCTVSEDNTMHIWQPLIADDTTQYKERDTSDSDQCCSSEYFY